MASKRPIVLNSGEIQQLQSSDLLQEPIGRYYNDYQNFTNNQGSSLVIGDICYYDAASPAVKKAKADAAATIVQLCFCTQALTNLSSGIFQFDGLLIIASAPFITNTIYYLSPTTAGAITSTIPTTAGQYVIRVGYAYGTTSLLIKIERPILLS